MQTRRFHSLSILILAHILSFTADAAGSRKTGAAKAPRPRKSVCEKASANIVKAKISSGLGETLAAAPTARAYVVVDSWLPTASKGLKAASVAMLDKIKELGLQVQDGLQVVANVPKDGFLVFLVTGSSKSIPALSALPEVLWMATIPPNGTLEKLRAGRDLEASAAQESLALEMRLTEEFLSREGAQVRAASEKQERQAKLRRLAEVRRLIADLEDSERLSEERMERSRGRVSDFEASAAWGREERFFDDDDGEEVDFDPSELEALIEERDQLIEELDLPQ